MGRDGRRMEERKGEYRDDGGSVVMNAVTHCALIGDWKATLFSPNAVSKMNRKSPTRHSPNDNERVHQARKRIIQCESIIRKVLAIRNCFEELQQFRSSSIVYVVQVRCSKRKR